VTLLLLVVADMLAGQRAMRRFETSFVVKRRLKASLALPLEQLSG